MDNSKTYIIADFVKILDVPRTTLKDWMTRYEDYIEFEIRGRRKIYFESSLNVLKEIAEMRKAGKTAPEIILELSYNHPVNADITHEIKAPKIDMSTIEVPAVNQKHFPIKNNPIVEALLPIIKQQNEEMEHMLTNKLHDMASNLHEAQLASLLPIVKRQNEKTERMLTGKMHDMAENLHRNQLDGNRLTKQSARRLLLVIALILTMVVAIVLTSSNIYYLLMNQKRDLRSVEKSLKKNISQSKDLFINEIQKRKKSEKEQMLKLQKLSTMLEDNKENSHNNITKLKNIIEEQQKSFTKMMKKYSNLVTEQRKNETDLFKGTVDKERGFVMKKIDELIRQNTRDKLSEQQEDAKVLELKEKIFELKQKMKVLEEKASGTGRSTLPASYFPKTRIAPQPVKDPIKK